MHCNCSFCKAVAVRAGKKSWPLYRSSFGDLQKDTVCFSDELWRLKGSLENLNMDPHADPHAVSYHW